MPTSEMDSTARQEMWDLLLSEKAGRCIFISTIYTSAADLIADRIAFISDGKLIAYGTRDFLLNSVGSGYKLVRKTTQNLFLLLSLVCVYRAPLTAVVGLSCPG